MIWFALAMIIMLVYCEMKNAKHGQSMRSKQNRSTQTRANKSTVATEQQPAATVANKRIHHTQTNKQKNDDRMSKRNEDRGKRAYSQR